MLRVQHLERKIIIIANGGEGKVNEGPCVENSQWEVRDQVVLGFSLHVMCWVSLKLTWPSEVHLKQSQQPIKEKVIIAESQCELEVMNTCYLLIEHKNSSGQSRIALVLIVIDYKVEQRLKTISSLAESKRCNLWLRSPKPKLTKRRGEVRTLSILGPCACVQVSFSFSRLMIPIIVIIIILVQDTGLTLYGCLLVFCLSASPSVCPWSLYLSAYLLVFLLMSVSVRVSLWLSICSSDCLQRLSICLSLCPSIFLYVCLSF